MITLHRQIAGSVMAVALGATQAVGQAQQHGPAGASGSPTSVSAPATTPEYRIGPEDVLDIVVWKNADLTSRGVQVRPDGRISLPQVNDIQAAGLTPMELRKAIVLGLEPGFEGQEVSVIVREVHSSKVSVFGLVKTPGRFDLRSPATVLDALAMAGGFVDFAKRDRIYVLRHGTRLPFNYQRFVDEPSSQENFALQPGDIIVVP